MNIRKIVVGIVRTERAKAVLDAAVDLAVKYQAKLYVVQALPVPVEIPPSALTVSPDALAVLLQSHGQAALESQVKPLQEANPGLFQSVEAKIGTPWQMVCEAAKETSADLVVIGTHSLSLVDKLMGTTAMRVVNHVSCSVFLVRA